MEIIKDVAEHDQRRQSLGLGAQNILDKGPDAWLYFLLAHLRNMTVDDVGKALLFRWQPELSKSMAMQALLYFWQPKLSKSIPMPNLLHYLLYCDPPKTASKIQSHSDAQSLLDLLFHVSSRTCINQRMCSKQILS
jgi:hypothetical protein